MGMASVSWFYLFNIQVRANCTTACNIQAALQYVELTHVSSSVYFFFFSVSVSFYKNVHAAWNRFRSHAGPFTWWEGSAGRTEDEHWWVLVSRRISLIGYSHIHRDARRDTVSESSFLFVCLFPRQRIEWNQWWDCFFLLFFFFFLTTRLFFFQKVRLFVVKKSSSCARL